MFVLSSFGGACASFISGSIACMGGCVGGCIKPPSVNTSEKHSKKQKLLKRGGRGQATHAPKKDWWTSSSNEMESNSSNPRNLPRNASTVNALNHQEQQQGSRASTNNSNTTFVNHALILWNERRREWVGNRPRHRTVQPREPVISWSTTYEDLLATSRPFPQPVPLPEMVDFLVDVWEQEGLYE
ncbi:hypothetical protein R1sor_010365 [Riccia sorocarpa]|uniref:Gag1-like clamp domain-containing protein n=1 Tax=Riccia sorocarpa TaxID=122646 RepID=A0ABD3I3X1_9MARC